MYFQASTPDTGTELWVTDGTVEGTRMVQDINAGPGDSNPYRFAAHGDGVLMSATTAQTGCELWYLRDGAVQLVRDLNPGPEQRQSLSDSDQSEICMLWRQRW